MCSVRFTQRQAHYHLHLVDERTYTEVTTPIEMFAKSDNICSKCNTMSGHLDDRFNGFNIISSHGTCTFHGGSNCRINGPVYRCIWMYGNAVEWRTHVGLVSDQFSIVLKDFSPPSSSSSASATCLVPLSRWPRMSLIPIWFRPNPLDHDGLIGWVN